MGNEKTNEENISNLEYNSVTSDEIADDGESNDEKISLKSIRMKNLRGLIIAYLNINSLRNKFESLKFLIGTNVDVLVIAETKVNGTLQTHLHTRGAKIGLATPGKP